MSVRPSLRVEQLDSRRTDLREISYLILLLNLTRSEQCGRHTPART